MKQYSGKVIHINAASSKLRTKCDGCMLYLDVILCHSHMKASKGKCSALGLLDKVDHQLKILSDETAEENEWMQAGMDFLSYLYCGQSGESLSDLRYTLFTKKRGPPKIKSPTDHRMCRAAYQTCVCVFKS